VANASALDAPFEALFDRTAALSPDVTKFTTNGNYTIPPHTKVLDFIVVGGGGRGGNTTATSVVAGAGGGGAGEMVTRRVSGLAPGTVLDVAVGTGATQSTAATMSRVYHADGFWLRAYGGGNGGDGVTNTPGAGGTGGTGEAPGSVTADGGAGGENGHSGENGGIGWVAIGGRGGMVPSGLVPEGGIRGAGYGAGGGGAGGCAAEYDGGGGGGGGSGYGISFALAKNGDPGPMSGAAYGGDGGVGCVVIIAWRGAP
jgi:hypothetical protein